MRIVAIALLAVLGGIAPAGAQISPGLSPPPPPPPPRPPVIIVDPYGRGPPAPPERYIAPPRSSEEIAPPMRRPEPLPRMLPRVGN